MTDDRHDGAASAAGDATAGEGEGRASAPRRRAPRRATRGVTTPEVVPAADPISPFAPPGEPVHPPRDPEQQIDVLAAFGLGTSLAAKAPRSQEPTPEPIGTPDDATGTDLEEVEDPEGIEDEVAQESVTEEAEASDAVVPAPEETAGEALALPATALLFQAPAAAPRRRRKKAEEPAVQPAEDAEVGGIVESGEATGSDPGTGAAPIEGTGASDEPRPRTTRGRATRSRKARATESTDAADAVDAAGAEDGVTGGQDDAGASDPAAAPEGGRSTKGRRKTKAKAAEPVAEAVPDAGAGDAAEASPVQVQVEAPAEKPRRAPRRRRASATAESEAANEATAENATTDASSGSDPEDASSPVAAEPSASRNSSEGGDADGDVSDRGDSGDSSDSEDGERSEPRRRRRRGGRGRRRQGDGTDLGGDAVGGAAEDGSDDGGPAGPDGESGEGTVAEETDAAEGGEGGSARRRRRRRSSSTRRTEAASADPAAGRARDEVTALKGSTRLEAKRLRRREGRDAGRRRQIITEAEFLARRESVERAMVVRERSGMTQIAVLEDGVLVEHYVARAQQTSMVGNVYLGRVQNVLPSMEAAFVDLGRGRNAVLYAGEVNWEASGLEGQPRRIEQALKSGDQILVQVTKDPIGHKGARLTSQITLAGRYLVLVPSGAMTGISRKLPDTERARLKRLLKEIVPEGQGVIVRTAAEGASEEELRRDVERLSAEWADIQSRATGRSAKAPALLKGEPELSLRVVRDVFNEDFTSLTVSGAGAWATISDYVTSVAPDLAERLHHWTSTEDVFASKRIDEQLAKGMDRKVWLPSGGSLVIDRTEAMTVIDVNTGKFTGAGGTLEETVTRNNLEAAEEIVRQLRLRDIGGIIVIDFIDMVLESNRDLVLRRVIECLGRDRTRHQVAEVTSLGLVQMTRKRVGQGLVEAFSTPCEHCHGRGFVVSSEPHEHVAGPEAEPEETPRVGRRRGGRPARTGTSSASASAQPAPTVVDPAAREAVKATLAQIAAAAQLAHNASEGVAGEDMAGGGVDGGDVDGGAELVLDEGIEAIDADDVDTLDVLEALGVLDALDEDALALDVVEAEEPEAAESVVEGSEAAEVAEDAAPFGTEESVTEGPEAGDAVGDELVEVAEDTAPFGTEESVTEGPEAGDAVGDELAEDTAVESEESVTEEPEAGDAVGDELAEDTTVESED